MINTNPRNEYNIKIKRRIIPTLEVGRGGRSNERKLMAVGGGIVVAQGGHGSLGLLLLFGHKQGERERD